MSRTPGGWWDLPQVSAASGCAYCAETRHSRYEPFLGFWRRNGGLERFGSGVTRELLEGVYAFGFEDTQYAAVPPP